MYVCRRIIFLETVAAVPGMIAAMTRHLRSLRHMQRDYGWIHTLLGRYGGVTWVSTSKDMGGACAMAAVNASAENIYICIGYTLK